MAVQNYKMGLEEDQSSNSPAYLQLSGESGDLLLNETYTPPPPVSKDSWVGVGIQDSTRRGGL